MLQQYKGLFMYLFNTKRVENFQLVDYKARNR